MKNVNNSNQNTNQNKQKRSRNPKIKEVRINIHHWKQEKKRYKNLFQHKDTKNKLNLQRK